MMMLFLVNGMVETDYPGVQYSENMEADYAVITIFIMQRLEDKIGTKYHSVQLDASLPASRLYEHRGYHTKKL